MRENERKRRSQNKKKNRKERRNEGKEEGGFGRVVGYSETHGDPLTSSFLPFLFISVPYLTDPHQL